MGGGASGDEPAGAQPIVAQGTVERVTFYREETGYLVARVVPTGGGPPFVAVGQLPRLAVGERVRLVGAWTSHPIHGARLQVTDCQTQAPADLDGMRAYLGSGLVPGVGPALAARIVERFGLDTLAVIERTPERLREVRGLGPERREAIVRAWGEQRAVKEVMLQLAQLGVSAGLAARIFRQYEQQAGQVVRERPYDLARDVAGIGFRTADQIARSLGRPPDAPDRLAAGLVHCLWEAVDDGHVFLPESELLRRGRRLLGATAPQMREALRAMRQGSGGVVVEELDGVRVVYLAAYFGAEVALARRLAQLVAEPTDRLAGLGAKPAQRPARARGDGAVRLSDAQREAVRAALSHKLAVLTGGPGTGKTTAIRELVALLEGERRSYVLAAPTGKAARRLADATGRPAGTLHRLLGLTPGGAAQYGAKRPLPADLVIVDEASMLDLQVANALVRALPRGGHLLLVGDVDQLPPVGAGDVLREIIDSGAARVARLDAIFRQGERSGIVLNAHRIQGGLPPRLQGLDDVFFVSEDDPGRLTPLVVDLATRRLPGRYPLDPRRDVQVLTPMHRGPLGVAALNEQLQQALNPAHLSRAERRLGARVLRTGDRVLVTKNWHERDVFNGDTGTVVGLDPVALSAAVALDDGRRVELDAAEQETLLHAYARAVPRAQGSEFPAVVLVLHPLHGSMLRRDLLYTAITRARSLLVIVGSRQALARAISAAEGIRRYNALNRRLRAAFSIGAAAAAGSG